ncbi:MAG: alpha/beta hydrolase [Candidatus Algichlamydia australiensis]|nr:alpha/beta hydrolase [Chlamydiales bacterium]
MKKVVFVPGNGGATTADNWFPNLKKDLENAGIQVIAKEFPDPILARESYWFPHLINELKVDKDTLLVGHSSGAIAAMKFAENHQIWGSILIGAYHTDLGMENEKKSGYFDSPWDWKKIRANQKKIVLFASQDDPWVPIEHPRHIHKMLACEYHEFTDQGHFGGDYYKESFPELTAAILRIVEIKKDAVQNS